MTDRPRCPFCKSPDTVPYPFGKSNLARAIEDYYPRAGRCMDCERAFYDYEQQGRPFVLPRKMSKCRG